MITYMITYMIEYMITCMMAREVWMMESYTPPFYDYNDDAALCIVHFGEGWPNNSGQ